MKQKLQHLVLALGMIAGASLFVPATTQAIDVWGDSCKSSDSKICKNKGESIKPLIKNIINVLIWAAGIVAVVMIIIGGIRYVTSNGDSSSVTAAKNTIMYAVIGLIIVLMAYAIVNFVIINVT